MISALSNDVLAFDRATHCTRVVRWSQAMVIDADGKEITCVEAAGWVDRYYSHKLKGWGLYRERGTFSIVVRPAYEGRP